MFFHLFHMVTDRLLSFGTTWHYVGFCWHSSKKQNFTKNLSANYFAPNFSIQRIICNFVPTKIRKRSKLLRMNSDLLVEYVLVYELAIYRVFRSSAFCITLNNFFCIAKVLIFSHFTKNSQRKNPFCPHFG